MKAPTQKQREKYLSILIKRSEQLSSQILAIENEIESVETEIANKTVEKENAYSQLLEAMQEYSMLYLLNWSSRYPDLLAEDEIPKDSEIRTRIRIEVELENDFNKWQSARHNELQNEISDLKKLNPGKLRPFAKKSIQKKIVQAESSLNRLTSTEFPRRDQLAKLYELLVSLDSLAIESCRIRLSGLSSKCDELRTELMETTKKKIGDEFEKYCVEYVEAERIKRKNALLERKQAEQEANLRAERDAELRRRKRKRQIGERERLKELEARRVKVRAASLKAQARRSEAFLAQHSESSAKRDLQNKRRIAENRQRELLRTEEACVRKVKQLRVAQRVNQPSDRKFRIIYLDLEREELLSLLKMNDWHEIPSLDNLVVKLREAKEDLGIARRDVKKADVFVQKFKVAKETISEFSRISLLVDNDVGARRGTPPRIPVENWDDAEELAVRYIKWLGFADAKRTAAGSDEGKDVESAKCVAQVKDMGTGATRPMLQQLFGVASAEKKSPLFFSRGYAKTALEWGEKHGVALFKFDLRGTVTPLNTAARRLANR
jgi:hypothetical protein